MESTTMVKLTSKTCLLNYTAAATSDCGCLVRRSIYKIYKIGSISLVLSILLISLFLSPPAMAEAGKVYGEFKTIMLNREVIDPGNPSEKITNLPAYQFITLGCNDIGVDGLGVYFSTFGLLHIVDPVDGEKFTGDILNAYVSYTTKNRRVLLKAGRQIIFDGSANNAFIDGGYLRLRLPLDIEFSAFGGLIPWPRLESSVNRNIYGARLAYNPWDYGHIGVSFFQERDGGELAREGIGFDYGFRYFSFAELSGFLLYDDLGKRLQETSVDLELDLPYDLKAYAGYSLSRPDARIPKTSIFSIFTDGKYQSFGGEVGYFSEGLLSVRLSGRYLIFDGGGSGFELKLKPVVSSGRVDADMAGIEVGRLKEEENGYTSLRFFGSYRLEKLTATLDANNYFYDEKVKGYSRSHIVTLTFGYDIFENANIQGDIVATVNPDFNQEWVGLLKFNYFFNSFAK